jgi:hypothetical protein
MNIHSAGQGTSERVARVRRFLIKILWKCLGVAVLDFLLTAVWGPNLINRHQNLALAAAVVCFVVALFATGWLLLQLWLDIGLLNHPGRRGALAHHRTIED